jgi:hypothetical protein
MGTLDQYRDLIEKKLTEFVELPAIASDSMPLREQLVFDRQRDNYLIFQEGWNGSRRVHRFVVHLEIQNGKILIHEDWTENGIARDLEAAGVPKSDIVLSFQPPNVRPLTGYAAA